MSSKARAQDDFYLHINGGWIENAQLPKGYATWGSFEMLHKKSVTDVENLINELVNSSNRNADQDKIVAVFKNYLNFEQRNAQGINPILPIISDINNLKDKKNFTDFMIDMNKKYGLSFFYSKDVDSDFKDSNLRALGISPMGLGMRDRDFYEENHPRHAEIKKAYSEFIKNITHHVKNEIIFRSKNLFELVYNFELELSKIMLKNEEKRNPSTIYNVVTIDQLNEYNPFFGWAKYLEQTGYSKAKKIILTEPKYLQKLNELLDNMDLEDLKDILKLEILCGFARLLSFDLEKISFDYSAAFSGVKEMRQETERAVGIASSLVGELIGKEYVKKHFSEEAKKDVLSIVNGLIEAYKVRLKDLEWMSESTKIKAIEKVDSFTVKIGYPDKWEDFSKVELKDFDNGGSLYQNFLNARLHFREKELNEINLPVDKSKWYMYPQTVNAYYNPTSNEICFPAAILQLPFYSIDQSKAKNCGGIGAVIGHEISHGFDDQGSQFDKNGNFENWWTKEDYEKYNKRTEKLVKQYDEYEINGTHVNGKLTLGENIGDLGGVNAALDVCLKQNPEDIKGFFENYALVWSRIITPEERNTRLFTDPHSPEQFRCNGILVNIDKFHELYETKPGDKMYKAPEDRIKIW
ncbi:endopeptidase O [Spiroplasma helicoides]|uniref:Endopeptidase O n=1 Tax=Spiroplasma helicoides TaxID=216938 RepID=A0A1B3SLG1_9MOLU|nr:M13 family metallopeptidase [Spiroplasma helicoides]AOG60771.1 endopeptidase O [Spiroplasma helicoides]